VTFSWRGVVVVGAGVGGLRMSRTPLTTRCGRPAGPLGFSAPGPLMRLRALIADRAPVADAATLLQPELANAQGATGDR
jgi:hypothetical protein